MGNNFTRMGAKSVTGGSYNMGDAIAGRSLGRIWSHTGVQFIKDAAHRASRRQAKAQCKDWKFEYDNEASYLEDWTEALLEDKTWELKEKYLNGDGLYDLMTEERENFFAWNMRDLPYENSTSFDDYDDTDIFGDAPMLHIDWENA